MPAGIGLRRHRLGLAQHQGLAPPASLGPELGQAVEGRGHGLAGEALADQLVPGPLGGLAVAGASLNGAENCPEPDGAELVDFEPTPA